MYPDFGGDIGSGESFVWTDGHGADFLSIGLLGQCLKNACHGIYFWATYRPEGLNSN